jgi:hypothetical protein
MELRDRSQVEASATSKAKVEVQVKVELNNPFGRVDHSFRFHVSTALPRGTRAMNVRIPGWNIGFIYLKCEFHQVSDHRDVHRKRITRDTSAL